MAQSGLLHRTRRVAALGGAALARPPVALELEVSPANVKAFALYDRLGFRVKPNMTLRLLAANDLDT